MKNILFHSDQLTEYERFCFGSPEVSQRRNCPGSTPRFCSLPYSNSYTSWVSCFLCLRVKEIGDGTIENNFIESTIEKNTLLPNMKHFLILILLGAVSAHALDGVAQSKVELIYDIYRERHLETTSKDIQVQTLKKIDTALSQYKIRPTITPIGREIVTYLQHLLCHTQSLLTGSYCKDGYYPESILTTNKKNLALTQIRNLLIAEHSRRRIDR